MPTPRQAALSMLNQVLAEGRLMSEPAALRALEGLDAPQKPAPCAWPTRHCATLSAPTSFSSHTCAKSPPHMS